MLIKYFQNKDFSDAKSISMTEKVFAGIIGESGTCILCHRDRYWKETYPSFYEPVHWMARLKAEQATRPSPFCWGFRASLDDDSLAVANGGMPNLFGNRKQSIGDIANRGNYLLFIK